MSANSTCSEKTMESSRPFSPDQALRIVQGLQTPAVFLNMTEDWPALAWTAEHLSDRLQGKPVKFRLGRRQENNTPQFETQCSFVKATLGHFLHWTQGQTEPEQVGPFWEYSKSEYWAYADYKYIAEVFEEQPDRFKDVRWCDFGFPARDGRDSTLWVGTGGANTPCHLDSYGCNLVLQVQGRKRWRLFPPDDTWRLYPTRIPYEESSVFSRVHVLNPDLDRFKDFREAREHCVTLLPGQVLFVPRHWWHFVESVDPVTVSVNSWIELEVDDEARIGEAVTRAVVCAFKSSPGGDGTEAWLNPTEAGVTSPSENMQYLNLALSSFSQRPYSSSSSSSCNHLPHMTQDILPCKRRFTGQTPPPAPPPPPFGPHLLPVSCSTDCRGETHKRARKSLQKPAAEGGIPEGEEEEEEEEEERKADEEPARVTLGTNDLLDCLLHPDVIKRVTELLIHRLSDARS